MQINYYAKHKLNTISCTTPLYSILFLKMSKPVCIICDEKVPPSKATSCPYCEFNPCRTCVRKYVLNESETKCMNCKKTWTRAHQNVILLPAFVNSELREHQEQVFYEREMALFPTTIEVIEDRRILHRLSHEIRLVQEKTSAKWANMRYLSAIIRENNKLIALQRSIPKMFSDVNPEELVEKTRQITMQYEREKIESTQDQQREQVTRRLLGMTPEDRRIAMANHIDGADPAEVLETLRRTGQLDTASKRARTQFIRACPIESCRGFLSQQWKCGLCNVYTCSKCNVPKCNVPKCNVQKINKPTSASEPEPTSASAAEQEQEQEDAHVCNPDDVATAELLAKDTKPCPQCGTGIFKIDGCDQMWCTECKTAFNWRTGQLETGHFHNPHYFEYQRRIGANARNILDMPCNALPADQYHGILHHLINIAMNAVSCSQPEREKRGLNAISKEVRQRIQTRAMDYAVGIAHFANHTLPRYRPDAIQNNLELRVQYLTEQITKEGFKSALSREAKQYNKKLEIGQIVQTVVFGMSDILTRLVNFLRETNDRSANANYCDHEKILGMFSEIDTLIDYANECLEFICKQYKLTRVAIFVRDNKKKHQTGLYTVRVTEDDTPEGKVTSLLQVRIM